MTTSQGKLHVHCKFFQSHTGLTVNYHALNKSRHILRRHIKKEKYTLTVQCTEGSIAIDTRQFDSGTNRSVHDSVTMIFFKYIFWSYTTS